MNEKITKKILYSTALLGTAIGFVGLSGTTAHADTNDNNSNSITFISSNVSEIPNNYVYELEVTNVDSASDELGDFNGVKIDYEDLSVVANDSTSETIKQNTEQSAPTAQAAPAVDTASQSQSNATYNNQINVQPQTVSVTPASATITPNYNQNNTYPIGQCTWGVKALAPWVGNWWGNARDWIASAQANGHTIGTTPVVGAVAVWPEDGGGYGHVAVVTDVQSATNIQVSESNYAGQQYIGNFRGWFNPQATWSGSSVYYIYQ